MMALSRRACLAGVGMAAAVVSSPSDACTVIGKRKPVAFSDAACRRSLRKLVDLINDAPALPDAEVTTRAADLSIRFDESVTDPILNYPNFSPIKDLELVRGWSVSAAKRDRSPINIEEINLLKGSKGMALYQFTLRRDRFHAGVTDEEAAGGSCDVAFDPFFSPEDVSYLGLFQNNKLREVWAFDQWLREM
ncbi:MAG: hypothetical protein ABWZ75_09110 [Novosphingobium sp.]